MPTLYNCKHSGDQYRISKFNSDFEVEASYLCDLSACECPAGHRSSCRHREMLPKFIAREAVGSNWFFDFDRGGWVQGWKEEPLSILEQIDTSDINLQVGDKVHVQLDQGMTDDEASEMLKQPNEFADKILEETDRMERAMQEKYGCASAALPLQQDEPSSSTEEELIFEEEDDEELTAEDIEALPDGLEKDYQREMQEPSLAPVGLGQASNATPLPFHSHSQMVTTTDFESVDEGSSPSVATRQPSPTTIRRRV